MNNNIFHIHGRNALITGAAGLLGLEHSIALLETGAGLILTDIDIENLVKIKTSLLEKFPSSKIHILEMDVTNENSINEVSDKLKSKEIDVDILINNAALNPKVEKKPNVSNLTRLESFSLNQWDLEIAVGLTGAFLCSKIFGTQMSKTEKGGCIVNIASDLSIISPDQRLYKQKGLKEKDQPVKPITYSVIKSGLLGLTKYLATYWIDSKIRCNSLSPGGIYNSQDKDFVEKISSLIPLGRMAHKNEYRAAIQFLCSDASSYMNGHNLVMDGGRSVW